MTVKGIDITRNIIIDICITVNLIGVVTNLRLYKWITHIYFKLITFNHNVAYNFFYHVGHGARTGVNYDMGLQYYYNSDS
jgi:hypothetical protein